jgi:tripartite-type tricarboxylate transporter receptor subunit TctC
MLKLAVIPALVAALLASALANAEPAAAYPTRTVKIIVGYTAGGGTDIVGRLVAQKLQEALGQTFIVENRPGANGMLGPDVASKAPPDGYTLLFAAVGQMAISPAVYPKIPYHPLKNFIPVSMMSNYPMVMVVNKEHPAKTLPEFIAWSKANPDKTNYASTSAAFTLTSELFKIRTGTPGQVIPFKSSNESVLSVVANQVTYAIAEPPPVLPQVAGGHVRAIGVTALERMQELPDVPTMKEGGADVNVQLWLGLFAVAGTPPEIVAKLEAECRKMAQAPDFKAKLRAMATNTVGTTSAEFSKLIDDEIKMWSDVAKQANVQFE